MSRRKGGTDYAFFAGWEDVVPGVVEEPSPDRKGGTDYAFFAGWEDVVPGVVEETVVEDTSLMQAWRTETYTKWLAGLLTAGQVVDLLGATASPACDP
ncbi:hypothetical protein AK812_SmicGene46111 [Symbiodinium microadriaticum]|uniref:Uncharacterized protein n=1 Tax=Symbiodinium microadriaticum TaxID=2951 RepID=A0A1Q9BUM8_SYMMI|nr:hypothetical protein AK812_SmicGene46111 [Symbiodinium microadriaticum]